MSADSFDEIRAHRLRQRLWGATIIIALAVIFLPLLLDGSGSESQFRRVERLREEPPRVINIDGTRETVTVPTSNTPKRDTWWARTVRRFTEQPDDASQAPIRRNTAPQPREEVIVEDEINNEVIESPVAPSNPSIDGTRLQAWVVQAGSFADEANAVAVRNSLRRAGYPSFVTPNDDESVFRVRVGPIIDKAQASVVQDEVVSILGREAVLMPYP